MRNHVSGHSNMFKVSVRAKLLENQLSITIKIHTREHLQIRSTSTQIRADPYMAPGCHGTPPGAALGTPGMNGGHATPVERRPQTISLHRGQIASTLFSDPSGDSLNQKKNKSRSLCYLRLLCLLCLLCLNITLLSKRQSPSLITIR